MVKGILDKSKKDGLQIAFFDRDGVINKKAPEHEYITKLEEFVFNSGIFRVLEELKIQGFEFIIISNQRGIARGKFTEQTLLQIHEHMRQELGKRGIKILDIFYCPHEKDTCNCRKPKPGMLLRAIQKYQIDLDQSLFVDDDQTSVDMAKSFGIGKPIFVSTDKPEEMLSEI